MENKSLLARIKNTAAEDVSRQHISRHLDARKIQTQKARQPQRQSGFTHSGHILNEDMPTRQKARKGKTYGSFLTQQNLRQSGQQLLWLDCYRQHFTGMGRHSCAADTSSLRAASASSSRPTGK